MMMNLLNGLFGDTAVALSTRIARVAILLYAVTLPFTHNAAIKNIALIGMLVALIFTLRERRFTIDPRSPILQSIAAVMVLALLSSLVGIEVPDNINAYRKHFLPLVLAVPLVLIHFQSRRCLLVLLAAITAAFGIRSALALTEMFAAVARDEALFVKGYAMESALYAPLLAGLAIATRGRWRILWSLVLCLVAVAVMMNGSRTAALAVTLGCVAVPVVLGRWRQVITLVAIGGMLGALVLLSKPDLASRYEAAMQASSYSGPTGMAIRYPIWMGVWEIAMQRPLLGHGFGWKKLGATAVREGYLDRWRASGDPYLAYTVFWFSLPTDKVNPHNLALELLFETGFVGLAGYAAMLLILFWQAFILARRLPDEWRTFAATSLGFLASYMVINISNGLWIGVGPSIFMVALLEQCRLKGRRKT